MAPDGGKANPTRLQRRCSCGANAQGKDGECEECKTAKVRGLQARLAVNRPCDPFEREADAASAQALRMSDADVVRRAPVAIQRLESGDGDTGRDAPPIVEEVVRSPGRPLDRGSRAFFEPRFGCDFSTVRVHDDSTAARSARAVSAHAYTVGTHVVFGSGRYAPQSAAGRELMAHELTHVVQQRAVVQRHSISPEPRLASDEQEEEEAVAPAVQNEEEGASHGGLAAGAAPRLQRQFDDDPFASPWPEKDEADRIRAEMEAEEACREAAGPDPLECDPSTTLTWADFAGTPGGGTFSAMTFSGLRERALNVATLRCTPHAPGAADLPTRGIQAFMDASRSWVRPAFANASDPAQNGCAAQIASCVTDIAAGSTGIHLLTTPSATCPASATPRGDVANTSDECTSALGTDCTDRAVAESARLLRHEQGHFDLTCAMAQKANAQLGTARSFDALLTAAQSALNTAQRRYDTQSNHGCNAAAQATWESDIAAGLPAITITIPRPGGRRRRR